MSKHPAGTWSGVVPAALTHFTADGALDADATADHLRWLIRQGAHGLIVGGTSGEFISLEPREHRQLIDIAIDAAAGQVPLIVGTGRYSTRETLQLTEYAAQAGADGALVVQPYFQRPNRQEILAHYRTVASVGLPLMIYNIPANSAAAPVSVEDAAALYAEGVAQAIKSTLPTVHQLHELRAATDDGFRVFYGGITSPLEGIAGGAHAWVSGLLNVAVPEAVKLWDALARSDLPAAREALRPIFALRTIITRSLLGDAGDLAVYRGLLRLQGRPAGYCRAPLRDLTSEQLTALEAIRSAA
ncbi:4-hydroxy-tetrahydrodipicolinate synthase [Kribbella hippodromi]|uniref:4-hydroxy-tetrahydrodipicolinate synthase n=1 Tax=Kribbella hippodromi TaxID=434347 RepID=A0ABP4QAU5_9ACTN